MFDFLPSEKGDGRGSAAALHGHSKVGHFGVRAAAHPILDQGDLRLGEMDRDVAHASLIDQGAVGTPYKSCSSLSSMRTATMSPCPT